MDVSTHRHELEADAHRRSVAELVLSVETPHVLDDPGERHSEAYAAEGLGGGAVDAHDELAEAGGFTAPAVALLTARSFADRLAEPNHDGLERRPLHEPLGLVPSVPDAGRAAQVAGVGRLDVDLAQRVGADPVATLPAAGRP